MTRNARLLLVAMMVTAAHGCSGARYSGNEPSGPSLTFPAHFAEGEPSAASPASSASAGPEDAGAAPAVPHGRSSLPDPEPLRTTRHWEYLVSYDAGRVRVVSATERVFPKPVVAPRHLGRYAIELWIGRELVDRVRFDFPGLAGEPPSHTGPRPLKEPPTLSTAAVVAARVLVPASPRATRAILVDRMTGSEQGLPWPPDAPLPPVALDFGEDGGAPAAEAADAAADSPDN